ncbi:MAG: aspartate kinase [Bacteroidetes bacterium]|nr:aspartate kinase [Bacteroidota bacterium]
MKVFKFGGASVKDADAIKNVAHILTSYPDQKILVVVSAMGKTTNALERLVDSVFDKKNSAIEIFSEIRNNHFSIIEKLFENRNHPIYQDIHNTFVELEWAVEEEPTQSYDCTYDQIVSIGEIISSKIISYYLNEVNLYNKWLDVRDVLKTDESYREAKVNWAETEQLVLDYLNKSSSNLVVTQGFIGVNAENYTTTLGREGSDYTASILAYCLNAECVIIWKDVPGVLNADPKFHENAILLKHISYQDAVELAYYGASVIHPKTIKPLQNRNIPLYVKSFLNPANEGTLINNEPSSLPAPCFIFKRNQLLISIYPKDFSFIVEDNLRDIFNSFADFKVHINMMQNSALSFSVCVDDEKNKISALIAQLSLNYKVLYNSNVELLTIRYYNQSVIDEMTRNKTILLEVKSRYNVQLVLQ